MVLLTQKEKERKNQSLLLLTMDTLTKRKTCVHGIDDLQECTWCLIDKRFLLDG